MPKKMGYSTFKVFAREELKRHLPPEYADWRVEMRTVYKVNETLECLHLMPPDGEKVIAVPNLYLQDFYQFVELGYSAEKALKLMADVITSSPTQEMLVAANFDINDFKESIVWVLINREKNRELLQTVPHRSFLDLAVVYRILVFSPTGEMMGSMVTNEMMKSFDETEESLFFKAQENTLKALPVQLDNLADVIRETEGNLTEEELKKWGTMKEGEVSPFYMLSNEMRTFGAAALLYPDALEHAAEVMDSNYYILPSSIHEVMMIPISYGNPEIFHMLVREANQAVVNPAEWLSDQVYLYDRRQRQLRMV